VGREARLNDLIIGAALLAALACVGCGGMTPGPNQDFWDQCVKAEAYGLTMLTQYGPINFGKVTWERNIACDKDLKKDDPLSHLLTR